MRDLRACLFHASPNGNVIVRRVDILPVDQAVYRRVIEFGVQHRSTPIFYSIFNSRDGKDKDQGYGAETRIRSSEYGENLYTLDEL